MMGPEECSLKSHPWPIFTGDTLMTLLLAGPRDSNTLGIFRMGQWRMADSQEFEKAFFFPRFQTVRAELKDTFTVSPLVMHTVSNCPEYSWCFLFPSWVETSSLFPVMRNGHERFDAL